MQISYYGLSCFRFLTKPGGRATEDVVLYIDPLNEKGVRSVYGKGDIILCSQGENNCSTEMFKGDTKIFDLPGEYAVQGVNVFGVNASNGEGINIPFIFESEDIRVGHLGRAHKGLEEKQLELFEEIDILFVPVGGNKFMDAKTAAEVVRKIEPKVVIPMMYKISGIPYDLEDVKKFLGEMGVDSLRPTDKLVCKKKDIAEKGMEVVLLASQR